MTANPPPYGYSPPPPPPPGVPTPPARRSTPWLAVIAAFVVGAVVAGVIVYFVASGSDEPATSSDSITLPSTIGSLKLAKDVRIASDTKDIQGKNAAAQQKDDDANAKRLSSLHGGAGTTIASYASNDLQQMVTVTAIRTRLDPLYVFQAEPERLGLVVPEQETKTYGDVTCLVHNPTTPLNQKVDKSMVFAIQCQRSTSTLTVQVQGLYSSQPEATVKLTDEVFDKIS